MMMMTDECDERGSRGQGSPISSYMAHGKGPIPMIMRIIITLIITLITNSICPIFHIDGKVEMLSFFHTLLHFLVERTDIQKLSISDKRSILESSLKPDIEELLGSRH